jgi:DNA-binding transcriptional LysR family regulator
MERGELDIAPLMPQSAPRGLHSRSLLDEDYVCVLRDGDPLGRRGRLSWISSVRSSLHQVDAHRH